MGFVWMVETKSGKYFFDSNPAVSDEAAKRIRAQISSWRLRRKRTRTTGTSPAAYVTLREPRDEISPGYSLAAPIVLSSSQHPRRTATHKIRSDEATTSPGAQL